MGNNTATTTTIAVAERQLLNLNPADLVVDENVRTDTARYVDLVSTLATDGVLQPLLGDLAPDGSLTIRDGQLRTLAAREAGLETVPVYVRAVHEGDTPERTRRRIVEQVNANRHVPLKLSEEAAAVEQLALTGMSATKIARALHTSKPKVDAALATAKSESARAAVDTHDLTLEHGMVLAQYDDDPQAVAELLRAAQDGRFEHKAAELDATADKRAAMRTLTADLTAQGYTIYTEFPYHPAPDKRLADLVDEAGVPATTENADKQYLRAWVRTRREQLYFTADGTAVPDDDIDWSLDGDDDESAIPEDGLHDPRQLTNQMLWTAEAEWWHSDPGAENLIHRYDHRGGGAPSESEAAAQKDAERAARLQTRTLNQLAEAAQSVRREALRAIVSRKTLPKGVSTEVSKFLALTVWFNPDLYQINRQSGATQKIAAELLGDDPMEVVAAATGERAQIVALAITLAAHEANMPKDAWRGGPEYYPSVGAARSRYLEFLNAVFGYVLADVEKVVTGALTIEDIDIT